MATIQAQNSALTATPNDHNDNGAISFILRLGRALHTCGYASHRLEELLEQTAERLHLQGQFFSTPTSIYCGFGELENQRTFLIRAEPGDLNLGKLVDLDQVLTEVMHQRLSPAQGSIQIDEISQAKPEYGKLLTTLAFGAASASSSQFFGGGGKEMLASGGVGILIGLLSLLAGKYQALGKIFEPVAAFFEIASVRHLRDQIRGAQQMSEFTVAGIRELNLIEFDFVPGEMHDSGGNGHPVVHADTRQKSGQEARAASHMIKRELGAVAMLPVAEFADVAGVVKQGSDQCHDRTFGAKAQSSLDAALISHEQAGHGQGHVE